ncbi:hypothetical protein PIIN_05632 [Serendipita indica DSM 11827]|uniref:Uncharacterized protein n=1 Tax=Serendipita indica (strain DSM 11827) TaxID=1109443 RepID=G4TK54_SERID|nr:hypothetical protein PIIN_05632 [Serendipita indica DSM 11827]
MLGFVGAAICAYCPPAPFASARARHTQYTEAFHSNLTSCGRRCQSSLHACAKKQSTSVEQDMQDLAWSMEKIKFKLAASQWDDRDP